jgi:energy-coupling factor transporter ATP-binding protein EcfA2
MKKTIAVVSAVVDATIGEFFRDTVIETYISLQHLAAEVSETPKRIQRLVVVSDAVTAAPSVAFNLLIGILGNSFFKAEQVVYITPGDSKERSLLDYLITEGKLPEIDVYTGEVTREFILSVIKGVTSGGGLQTRIAVTRRRAADFMADELAKKKGGKSPDYLDDTAVVTEEAAFSRLTGVSGVRFQPAELSNAAAEMIQVVGAPERGKSTFLMLLAQLLSISYRCVLVENDLQYFSLSAYLRYSGAVYTDIPVSMIYTDPRKAIFMARHSQHNLICFTGDSGMLRERYSKPFINRFVYNMLGTDVSYILLEAAIGEMLPAVRTVMVLNNDLISILKDTRHIPYKPENLRFVALVKGGVEDTQIQSSAELTALLSQLLSMEVKTVPIYQITSLSLGAEAYDLGSVLT